MKAALYCRVSTSDGRQDVQVQLMELRNYCKVREWEICGEFCDTLSGKSAKRPQLDAMMKLVRHRRFQAIVIIRLSRLGRSVPHLVAVVSELENFGVKLISLHEAIDLSSPNGKLMFHIFSALSQFEVELVSERIRSGLAYAKFCNRPIGRPRTINSEIVTNVIKMRAAGQSIRAIAKSLNISSAATHKLVQQEVKTTPMPTPLSAGKSEEIGEELT